MKKYIYHILALFALLSLFTGCESTNNIPVLDSIADSVGGLIGSEIPTVETRTLTEDSIKVTTKDGAVYYVPLNEHNMRLFPGLPIVAEGTQVEESSLDYQLNPIANVAVNTFKETIPGGDLIAIALGILGSGAGAYFKRRHKQEVLNRQLAEQGADAALHEVSVTRAFAEIVATSIEAASKNRAVTDSASAIKADVVDRIKAHPLYDDLKPLVDEIVGIVERKFKKAL